MSIRRFAIPLTTLNLLATTGCTDIAVDDWLLEEMSVDGDERNLSYTYNGVDVEISGELTVDDELGIEMDLKIRVTGGGYDESYSYSWEGEAEKEGKGEYAVELDSQDDAEDMELDCTVEDDDMECEGEDDEGTEFEFVFERDS